MANRYQYQFNASFKPRMSQIEGFVSIGTGGVVNAPDAYPLFPVATGATGISGQTGPPRGLMPGQATAGVPTGWVGGFSGMLGLVGAGVAGVQRVATGLYAMQLSDDWCRLDSIQVTPYLGVTGCTNISDLVVAHSVGLGNTSATGGFTLPVLGNLPKNMIYIQFHASGNQSDLPLGAGFWIDIRVRDSLVGPQ